MHLVTTNDAVGVTYPHTQNAWIRGDSLSGHSGIELSEQPAALALAQDITDATRNAFMAIGRPPIRSATGLCVRITENIKQILEIRGERLVSPANVKVRIDHRSRAVHLVITDLADKIADFGLHP